MAEFKSNLNYSAEGAPGGPPEQKSKSAESFRADSLGGYPVEGRDVIELLSYSEVKENGNIDEVKEAILEALAFKEGLEHGTDAEAYGLDNINGPGMMYLKGLFTTVDDSIGRPADHYLKPAIKSALEERVREYGEYKKRPDRWKVRQFRKAQLANRARIMEGKEPLKDDQIEMLFVEPKQIELEKIGKAIPELQKLNNHVTARETIDKAFVQRMVTCENPEAAAKISDKFGIVSSPDQTHWESFFRAEPEFGEAVNIAMEAIRDIAMPNKEKLYTELNKKENRLIKEWLDNLRNKSPKKASKLEKLPWNIVETEGVPSTIYTEGFKDTEMFAKWLKHILKKDGVNGRVDVVWAAWRTALLIEIPSVLGKGVIAKIEKNNDEKEEAKVELKIGFPPLVSSLFSWVAHLEDKRMIEFGLDFDDQKTRATQYVSHSGLPMSLGKFPDLCKGYLQEAKIYLPSGKKNLWDIWTGGISFANEKFPWTKTEIGDTEDAGELPGGTFGEWMLRRQRSFGILDAIRSRPKLGELSDPDFFTSKARTWDKIMPLNKDPRLAPKPEENPRAWWVAGLIWYHRAGTKTTCPIVKKEPFRDHRTVSRAEEISPKRESAESRGPVHGDIFRHATNSGFLRKEDVEWIKKSLDIKLY